MKKRRSILGSSSVFLCSDSRQNFETIRRYYGGCPEDFISNVTNRILPQSAGRGSAVGQSCIMHSVPIVIMVIGSLLRMSFLGLMRNREKCLLLENESSNGSHLKQIGNGHCGYQRMVRLDRKQVYLHRSAEYNSMFR